MGCGFTSRVTVGSVFGAAVCKIQARRRYHESLPLVPKDKGFSQGERSASYKTQNETVNETVHCDKAWKGVAGCGLSSFILSFLLVSFRFTSPFHSGFYSLSKRSTVQLPLSSWLTNHYLHKLCKMYSTVYCLWYEINYLYPDRFPLSYASGKPSSRIPYGW